MTIPLDENTITPLFKTSKKGYVQCGPQTEDALGAAGFAKTSRRASQVKKLSRRSQNCQSVRTSESDTHEQQELAMRCMIQYATKKC